MLAKHLVLPLGLATLSACTTPGEKDFLCAAQTGQPCQSLSEVDGTSHVSSTPVRERSEDTRASTLSQQQLLSGKTGQGGQHLVLPDGGTAYASGQYRIPEQTGTLWIAPRRDASEILHEATFVHFVIAQARWGRL